jgi:hypothetical protein
VHLVDGKINGTTPGRVGGICSFTRWQRRYTILASIVEFCHQSGSSSIHGILLRIGGKGFGVWGLGSSGTQGILSRKGGKGIGAFAILNERILQRGASLNHAIVGPRAEETHSRGLPWASQYSAHSVQMSSSSSPVSFDLMASSAGLCKSHRLHMGIVPANSKRCGNVKQVGQHRMGFKGGGKGERKGEGGGREGGEDRCVCVYMYVYIYILLHSRSSSFSSSAVESDSCSNFE